MTVSELADAVTVIFVGPWIDASAFEVDVPVLDPFVAVTLNLYKFKTFGETYGVPESSKYNFVLLDPYDGFVMEPVFIVDQLVPLFVDLSK